MDENKEVIEFSKKIDSVFLELGKVIIGQKGMLRDSYYQPKKNHFKLEVIFLKIWKY